MDNLENSPAPQTELSALRAECDGLRNLIASLAVLLLVVSGTLNLYFWRQYRNTSTALKAEGPQISQMVANFSRANEPAIDSFIRKLQDFEKKNPDFGPILAKYGIRPGSFSNVPPATAAPPKK